MSLGVVLNNVTIVFAAPWTVYTIKSPYPCPSLQPHRESPSTDVKLQSSLSLAVVVPKMCLDWFFCLAQR